MGNEMGNNNVIGQQEESAKDFYKTMHHSDCSPGLNNINDKEKNDTKDEDMSEVFNISNVGDEKMASDQTKISAANENIKEKNMGSFQDHGNSNFRAAEGDETQEDNETVALVGIGSTVEDMTVENLEEGQTRVSTVYDPSTPPSVQGQATSSTAPILTDCHDAEIKYVFIEDESRERGKPSYVRPEDDTNQETSKNEEKHEICEMGKSKRCKTTAIDNVIESDHEVLEEDKKINQGEEFPNCSAYGGLDTGEAFSQFQSALAVSSATDGKEFQKHEQSIAAAREMSDSGSAAMEHNVTERTKTEHGVAVDKNVAEKNEADNFEGDKKSDGIHDFVSIVKGHREDFTGLGPPLSGHLLIFNEENVQGEVIIEELAAPMTAASFALQLVEDPVKEDIKPASSDINEGTSTSTYEAKTIDTRETTNNSEYDQPQQVLLEEPEVVKFENNETLTTCMQLVERSSATELVFPNVFHKERECASYKATSFTSESNEQKVRGVVGFAAESKQKEVIGNADKFSEEQCLLQKPTLGRGAGEETPLLLSEENINSSSYSSEQHTKVVKDIPVTNIALMQAKHEGVEESEKSPLLSPREPSEGAFGAPNHYVRKDKPLHMLMTEDRVRMWSSLKEAKNSTTVSSPRSKEKQKPKSSLFAICMCCTTTTK